MSRLAKVQKESKVKAVDTSKLNSIDLVDGALCQHNELYVKKSKLYNSIKDAKKDTAASYREQLKDIQEECDAEMANIRALEDHKKLINSAENFNNEEVTEIVTETNA